MGIVLSTSELDALMGLPHGAVALYVLAIRPRMDFKTGMVGERPRISWKALEEWVYQEGGRGTQPENLSIDQVRRCTQHLERVGLVKRMNQGFGKDCESLKFLCRLAIQDRCVQNKATKEAAKEADMIAVKEADMISAKNIASIDEAYEAIAAKQADMIAAKEAGKIAAKKAANTSVVKRLSVNPPPPTPSSVEDGMVEADGGVMNFSEEIKIKPKALHWPTCFSDNQKSGLLIRLSGVIDAQLLLDEVAGAMRSTNIKSPVRYLTRLIEKEQEGLFIPEFANQVQNDRAAILGHSGEAASKLGVQSRMEELKMQSIAEAKAKAAAYQEYLKKNDPEKFQKLMKQLEMNKLRGNQRQDVGVEHG